MSNKAEKMQAMRHTAAHMLAAASRNLRPETRLGVGPATEDGFFHDIDVDQNYTEADLPELQAEMEKIKKMDLPIQQREVSKEEAREMFAADPFKLELIDEIEGDRVGVSDMGNGYFVTLCEGGHVESTGKIGAFKLTKMSGVYWKGEEGRPQLQRVFGLAFATEKEMKEHEKMQEEAKKRDHRKLGKKLDLFTFSELIGSGLPLYTPRGAFIRRALTGYIEELQSSAGYMQLWTPQIAKAELFKISGHFDKYHENMFRVSSNYSDDEFYLKPMNCPQHTQVYNSKPRSYRDLPLRWTDFAMLYRDEKPGELSGLARVRSFSQDDCHIFCREDQVDGEIDVALAMTKEVMNTFGFSYRYRLSTRDPAHPEKYLGDPAIWNKVEKWAVDIMERNQIKYVDGPGEAAFYAPKMDLLATDALGREWQLSTIQIDYVMPERFGLFYTDEDGQKRHPVMIHRAIIGSPERFMMILLEHFAGALPLWLSPTQVVVLPIADEQHEYAHGVMKKLREAGLRAEIDDRSLSIGKKIREAQVMKVPVMLIIGKKEAEAGTVAVRTREEGDVGAKEVKDVVIELGNRVKSKE